MAAETGARQWLRYFRLLVQTEAGGDEAIDLSDFRVKFHISQALTGRPCTAEITIYNVSEATANRIKAPASGRSDPMKPKVVIEAGYQGKHSVIFKGDLWWKSTGRESETDTYLSLIAATGDRAHQYATVNQSLPAGASQKDELEAVIKALSAEGVGAADTPALAEGRLPRGKVLYGMARDALQAVADTNGLRWGYTDRGVKMVPKEGEIPEESSRVVALNAATGLLDRPELTVDGLKVRALLNPDLEVGRIIQVEQGSVQTPSYSTEYAAGQNAQDAATGASASADGLYVVYSREYLGDTRGDEWYSDLVCYGYNSAAGVMTPAITECLPEQ